jgi:ubiquinone/menaquinone biosynthesis C-methylase UbiE
MTMKELNKHEETVAQLYDSVAFEYEQQRLATSASVEFAITVRYLQRYLPVSARVAEPGVGSGQYTEVWAQKGCWLHLVNVSERLLETAVARLERAGWASQILDSQCASAAHLPHLQAASIDLDPFSAQRSSARSASHDKRKTKTPVTSRRWARGEGETDWDVAGGEARLENRF